MTITWISEPVLHRSIIGEQHQALTLLVEPPHWIHIRYRYIILERERAVALLRRELTQHSKWFVEQDVMQLPPHPAILALVVCSAWLRGLQFRPDRKKK